LSFTSARKTIEKLNDSHLLESFDCGVPELNRFLIKHALHNQRANSASTYIVCEGNTAIGFYSLAVGSVIHAQAPVRVIKGLAKYPVPVMILARLAVDKAYHGRGVGSGLLKDALLRTLLASDIAGIRALIVHAKDDNAKQWYQRFDFDPSPTDPLHLYLLLKDINRAVNSE
jgi:GNAT superfamily N-acetyltransferase